MEVRPGEIWQIVGANGSGKTSLLRLLAGLSQASRGEVQRQSPLLFLGHRPAIKSALTPLENLHWYCPGLPDAQLLAALDQWHLRGYETLPCQQLSAGQQQRVALCRLTLTKCSLWLLDEPFTALDREGVAQLEQCLLQQVRAGGAVVFTSHHVFSAASDLRVLDLRDYVPSLYPQAVA